MTCRNPPHWVVDLRDKGFHVAMGHVSSSNRGESKSARKLSRIVVHRSNIKSRKLS